MPIYVNRPVQSQADSPMDRIGELINLYRLPGETLKSFKKRILDVYIHPANATYTGWYNGISRELNLSGYDRGIVIDVRRTTEGMSVSPTLSVNMTSKRIEFIINAGSDEFYVDIQSRTGGGYYVHEFLSAVDAANIPFEVVTWGGNIDWEKTSYFLRSDSSDQAIMLPLSGGRLHTFYSVLDVGNWITAVNFSSDTGLWNEVSSIDMLGHGNFYVNKNHRIIHTHDPIEGRVSLNFESFPLVIPLGQISINSFSDSFFQDTITHQQVLTHSTEAIDSLEGLPIVDETPTVEGADHINELLSVAPMYWGE